MARYEAGETLASIARTYDCSPPAISYVVSRSRARQPGTDIAHKAGALTSPQPTSPQLVKSPEPAPAPVMQVKHASAESALQATNGESRIEVQPRRSEAPNGSAGERAADRHWAQPNRQSPSTHLASPDGHPNGDRRTLHLSLGDPAPGNGHGNAPGNGHGNGHHAEPHLPEHNQLGRQDHERQRQERPHFDPAHPKVADPFVPRSDIRPPQAAIAPVPVREAGPVPGFTDPRSAAYAGPAEAPVRGKEGSAAYIDQQLRSRVSDDITVFLAAFDAALAQDSQESRSALREATDRLLRAGARTRIELERLEARMPLPPRENIRAEPAWRHR